MENHVKHLNKWWVVTSKLFDTLCSAVKVIIELHSYHIRQKFLLIFVHNLKSQHPMSLNLENMWIAIMRFTACNSSALLLHCSVVHQCYKTWLNYTTLVPSSHYFLLLREDHLMRNCHHILVFSKEAWIPTGMGEQVQNHVKNMCFSFHLYLWYAHSAHLMINAVTYVYTDGMHIVNYLTQISVSLRREIFSSIWCHCIATMTLIWRKFMNLLDNHRHMIGQLFSLVVYMVRLWTYNKKIIWIFKVFEVGCPFSNCLHLLEEGPTS